MVEIAVLLIVLAVMFAAKAATIVLATDDTISKSASFSWMAPKPEDAVIPTSETMGAKQEAPATTHAYHPRARLA